MHGFLLFYFLNNDEIDLIKRLEKDKRILKLGDLADIKVPITTGAKNFFTVGQDTVDRYELYNYTKPFISKHGYIPSVIFRTKDWKNIIDSGSPAYFLQLPSKADINKNMGVFNYIKKGEKEELHKKYKCRIRNEWQVIPEQKPSPLLFTRNNHNYSRIIINKTESLNLTNILKVFPNKDVNINALVSSYYNSLTFMFAEIYGRSYGGGVLEILPKEVGNIRIPYTKNIDYNKLIKNIDTMLRNGENITKIMDMNDKKFLKINLGYSDKDIKTINNIWLKLKNRRLYK